MKDIQQRADEAKAKGFICVTGALIVNNEGNIFVHKRSPDRKLFPGCWDIVGGHIEESETVHEALLREITEETSWTLDDVEELVEEREWEDSEGNKHKEFIFLASVEGDLENPILEEGKVSEGRWVSPSELSVLLENREPGDTYIRDVVASGFKALERRAKKNESPDSGMDR